MLKNCGKIVEKSVNIQKVRVARVWCVTSLKVPARTHTAHLFEKLFRTHTHTCDRTRATAHVRPHIAHVRARTHLRNPCLLGNTDKFMKYLFLNFTVLQYCTNFIIYTCLLYLRESDILVIDETFFQPFSIKHWWLT